MTVAVPSSAPAPSRTLTVAPISPVPVTMLPLASSVAAGAAGGVRSGAVKASGGEALPAGSVWTTVSASPFACGVASVTA